MFQLTLPFISCFLLAECDCGCVDSSTIIVSSTTLGPSGQKTTTSSTIMGAPSNGSKTSHSKIANGSNHTTNVTSQASSKRSSSGADGDYQLVQHEVLFSLSSQYEVSNFF